MEEVEDADAARGEAEEVQEPKPPEVQDTPPIHLNSAVNAIIDTVRKLGTVLLLLPVHG